MKAYQIKFKIANKHNILKWTRLYYNNETVDQIGDDVKKAAAKEWFIAVKDVKIISVKETSIK